MTISTPSQHQSYKNNLINSPDYLQGICDQQRVHNLQRVIPFKLHYTLIGPGLTHKECIVLEQMVYWSSIHAHDGGWFFKTQPQWTLETAIKKTTFYKIRDKLVKLGLVEYGRKGIPAKMRFKVNHRKLAKELIKSESTYLEREQWAQHQDEELIEQEELELTQEYHSKITKSILEDHDKIENRTRTKRLLNTPKKKTKNMMRQRAVDKSVQRGEGSSQKVANSCANPQDTIIDNKITSINYNKDYLNADVDNFFAKSSQQSQQESDLKTKEKEKRDEVPPDKASINMQDITNPDKDGWLGRAFDEENNMPRSLYEELLVYLIDIGKEYDYNSVNRILKKIVVTAKSKGRSLIFENKQKLLSYLRKVFKYEKTQPSECNNNLDWRPKELHRYWVSTGLILSQ